MAVREFDGVNDRVVVDNGAVTSIANGAFSMVVVVRPLSLAVGEAFMSCQAPGTSNIVAALYDNSGGQAAWGDDSDYISLGGVGLTAASWQVYGISKAAGTTTIRFLRCTLGGSPFHGNSGGTSDGNAVAATEIEFGSTRNGAFTSWKDMRLAVAAVWQGTALSDGQFDSIVDSTQDIADLSPTGLWDFNQASTATNVTDLTGGGADQTAIAGTTVIADGVDDPPGWTFGLGPAAAAPSLYVVQSNLRLA